MGYYTKLDLKADFDTSHNNNINILRKFVDWYDNLTYDDYIEKYREDGWITHVKSNKFFTELEEFLLDYRCDMILSDFEFHSIDKIVKLSVNCEIKNYTDTYKKLYTLLLKCNPIYLVIQERGEDMKTPTVLELKNNELVQIQSGEYDV